MVTRVLMLLVVGACSLCETSGARLVAHSQDDLATFNRFVGAWRLVSTTEHLQDGTTRQYPFRVAQLVYTDSSRMCYVSMLPDRPKWMSETPSAEEAQSVVSHLSFYAYCAAVELRAKEGTVLHHVDIDKIPNLVGTVKKRTFTFDGVNRLSLRVDRSENVPPVVDTVLLWERIGRSGDPRGR